MAPAPEDASRSVSLYLDEDTIRQLDSYARAKGVSRSASIGKMLRELRIMRIRLRALLRSVSDEDRELSFKESAKLDFRRVLDETE